MKNPVLACLLYIASVFSMLSICAPAANAQYTYQLLLPPGADSAHTFGINNAGKVVGAADEGEIRFAFIYDMNSGAYKKIAADFEPLDINDSGVMVGYAKGTCAIRDVYGEITLFDADSKTDDSFCQARGINATGEIAGYRADENRVWSGFFYDPVSDSFEEFLPSRQTIAHAINAKGQIAGSVRLDAGAAYPGSPEGRYGFLREKNGSVRIFAVSQSAPGLSRARGISDSGLMAGFYDDSSDVRSYVTTLSKDTGFETITIGDDEMVFRKPCNPEVPSPGPEYELFTSMTASQVRDDGVVVGSCSDFYSNAQTRGDVEYRYGFIATPVK